METTTEKITPKLATQYLQMNTHNRPIRASHVAFLANEIKEGRWKMNGATIVFNDNKLIDGQHRLQAVISSGMPISTLVVRGVADASFATIDTGQNRTGGDVLHIVGEKYPNILATAARFVIDYLSDRLFMKRRIPNAQILSFVDSNPGLIESIEFIVGTKGNRLISYAMAGGLHFLMSKKDKELADEMFTGIANGFKGNAGQPFIAVREKLISCATASTYTQARVLAIYIIKAWNARRLGERIKVFRFMPGEDIPQIR